MAANENPNSNDQTENITQIPILEKNFNFDDVNDIPRETIMNIYGEDFENLISLLNEEEIIIKDYFIETQRNINEKYNIFKEKIHSYLKYITNKIITLFDLENNNAITNNNNSQNKENQKLLLIKKYSKDNIKKIENIINIQKQMMNSIKETMNIFLNFLDISNSLDKEKPIHDFINKEFKNIINSWMLLKLNLEKFDLAKALNNSGLDNNLKNFIIKIYKRKNFVMNISKPNEYSKNSSAKDKEKLKSEKNRYKNILKENYNNLLKLEMNNINDVDNYFDEIKSFENMKSLKLKNVNFIRKNNEFLKNFNKIKKLNITNAKNLEIKMLENLSDNLTSLSLSNNNLVDFEFNIIMNDYLKKSSSLRNNLEYLSFAKNDLTYINLNDIINQKSSFHALKNLDLSKNSIYKLNIPFEYFSELKCINICNNNFSRNYFNNIDKDIVVLQSGNLFLSNLNLAKNYFNDINIKLNKYPIKLIYLNLSFIPDLISNDYFSKLKINDTILLELKKINFSYNNMTNATFFQFIKNNKGLLNLKSLNLKGNKLNDLFFEEYLNLKVNNIFTKLKKINLEENLFGNDDVVITQIKEEGDSVTVNNKIHKLRALYKFISENKNLIYLSVAKNNIFEKFKIINSNQKYGNNTSINSKGNIIISDLNSFLQKIKNELLIKNDEKNNDYSRNEFNLKFDCMSDNNLNSEIFTNNNFV